MAPYKAGTGVKPKLKHFWVIGTTGFAIDHKPSIGWRKFKSQSTLCTLFEYEGDHIYCMLDPTKKIIRVSNVK